MATTTTGDANGRTCPNCSEWITWDCFDDLAFGDVHECPHCLANFKVTELIVKIQLTTLTDY